ncbi:hypothetical protein [Arenimonas sp. MALMAid1274]|uniref:hypothetical protein n=1 Tax=Arenimonas sp. MALMAid1274 TaxID=3411630 RepID=UPI003BA39003
MASHPWSKLERRLRDLPDPSLKLRFRFTAYRQEAIQTPWEGDAACKFWITQGKDTIWAVPRDRHPGDDADIGYSARRSPGWLVELAAEYLQLPRDQLLNWTPDWSGWGLPDLLKACDRRIGKRQFPALKALVTEPAALRLLDLRSGKETGKRLPVSGRDAAQTDDPN